MRTALGLPLVIIGFLLLAKREMLPLGLAMMLAGWWVYERSGWPDGDGLAAAVLVLGALGAAAQFVIFLAERF